MQPLRATRRRRYATRRTATGTAARRRGATRPRAARGPCPARAAPAPAPAPGQRRRRGRRLRRTCGIIWRPQRECTRRAIRARGTPPARRRPLTPTLLMPSWPWANRRWTRRPAHHAGAWRPHGRTRSGALARPRVGTRCGKRGGGRNCPGPQIFLNVLGGKNRSFRSVFTPTKYGVRAYYCALQRESRYPWTTPMDYGLALFCDPETVSDQSRKMDSPPGTTSVVLAARRGMAVTTAATENKRSSSRQYSTQTSFELHLMIRSYRSTKQKAAAPNTAHRIRSSSAS